MSTLLGIPVYTSAHLTEMVNVARSPSRALRRWRQGKRATNPMQRMPSRRAYVTQDGALVMHPETRDRLVQSIPSRESWAIGWDMAREPDRTVVAKVLRQPGKSVLNLISVMDRTLDGPPMSTELLERLITGQRALMESTERRLLGMATEQVEPSTLTLTKIWRLFDGGRPPSTQATGDGFPARVPATGDRASAARQATDQGGSRRGSPTDHRSWRE